ncbi:hypothetical protein [Pedobacter psychroterrae]|uniref:hypothetical protein n=1 Tax=Pedobacter psychroterrae TaxID=2530453 RepID=UPI0013F160D1|nr:hypothetical protein [Pedobacter psychroterrae]
MPMIGCRDSHAIEIFPFQHFSYIGKSLWFLPVAISIEAMVLANTFVSGSQTYAISILGNFAKSLAKKSPRLLTPMMPKTTLSFGEPVKKLLAA